MKTEVTELLGIEYPIIQGGMAWVAEYHLAAGVSNAGGLGLIGAASAPAEWVREQIREAKKLTDKPFGVNIMLISPYAEDVAKVVAEEGVKVVTTGAGSPEKCGKKQELKSFRWLHPLHLQEEWNGAGQMQLLRKDVNPEDTSEKIRLWYWFHRL